jgi:hypothetical protein
VFVFRRHTIIIVLIVFIFTLSKPSRGLDCFEILGAITASELPLLEAAIFFPKVVTVALHINKMMFYQLVGPFTIGHELWKTGKEKGTEGLLFEAPGRVFRRDGPHFAGFMALMILTSTFSTTDWDYRKETKEFDQGGDPDDVIVWVNAFDEGTTLNRESNERFAKIYGKNPRARMIRPRDQRDLVYQLNEIRKKMGPIKKLEMDGHGLPGLFSFGERRMNYDSLGDVRVSGLFAPDAKIRFHSCLTGIGENGRKFLEKVGNALLDRGGSVYASKLEVWANYLNFSTEEAAKDPSLETRTHLLEFPYQSWRTATSLFDTLPYINQIQFFPSQRVTKVTVPARNPNPRISETARIDNIVTR